MPVIETVIGLTENSMKRNVQVLFITWECQIYFVVIYHILCKKIYSIFFFNWPCLLIFLSSFSAEKHNRIWMGKCLGQCVWHLWQYTILIFRSYTFNIWFIWSVWNKHMKELAYIFMYGLLLIKFYSGKRFISCKTWTPHRYLGIVQIQSTPLRNMNVRI